MLDAGAGRCRRWLRSGPPASSQGARSGGKVPLSRDAHGSKFKPTRGAKATTATDSSPRPCPSCLTPNTRVKLSLIPPRPAHHVRTIRGRWPGHLGDVPSQPAGFQGSRRAEQVDELRSDSGRRREPDRRRNSGMGSSQSELSLIPSDTFLNRITDLSSPRRTPISRPRYPNHHLRFLTGPSTLPALQLSLLPLPVSTPIPTHSSPLSRRSLPPPSGCQYQEAGSMLVVSA
jgi:hypothetical protein